MFFHFNFLKSTLAAGPATPGGARGATAPPNILLTSIFLFNFILINILNKLAGAYP